MRSTVPLTFAPLNESQVCAFTDGDLGFLFDWMDSVDLWYQYDMRGSYLNLSSVAEQIPLVKDRSNLLSWYTADEVRCQRPSAIFLV